MSVSLAAIADLISRGRLKTYNIAGVPFVNDEMNELTNKSR